MWYDSFHCCDMIFQRVRDDGTVVYRCVCGTVMEVSMLTNASSLPLKPTRQPVPAAFREAFHDDELDPGVVPLTCTCGTPLTIKKYSPESTISGTFCQVCGEQHWIRWSDGIVRHGEIEGKDE